MPRVLPKDTTLGRLVGDEFALFVDGLPADVDNRGPIAHLARSILTEVNRAFQLNEHEVFLTASIGVAFCPRDAENVIDLIRNADAAMYYSKQNGGNTFAFYSPEMNAAAVERLMLKSKLRRALERDELVIRYQPKVDLRNGRIIGAEALLRWRLPEIGGRAPDVEEQAAPRTRARRARDPLPAEGRSQERPHHRRRGAPALAAARDRRSSA